MMMLQGGIFNHLAISHPKKQLKVPLRMGGGSTRGESLKLDTTYMTSQLKVDNMETTNSSLKIDSGNLKGGQPHYGHLTQN